MKKLPLISIVIPVFNGANYLRDAIISALDQTYKNIEVIVVNDGSNDEGRTRDIAISFGSDIQYFEKENGGVASALNYAIDRMQGDYFSWLSHDDLYISSKIDMQIKEIIQNPHLENFIIYSSYQTLYNGVVTATKKTIFLKNYSMRYKIAASNAIHGCTLLIPKIAFETCGTFNESLKYTQDNEMWFRLAGTFNFHYLDAELVISRMHSSQISRLKYSENQKEADKVKTFFMSTLSPIDFCSKKLNWWIYFPLLFNSINSEYAETQKYIINKMLSLGAPAYFLQSIYFATNTFLKIKNKVRLTISNMLSL